MTLKVSENPPTTYPENIFNSRSAAEGTPWWVVRTKSRQEKALAWSLHGLGISYFLPLVARPQVNRNRTRVAILPLFSGYLFFRGSLQARQILLKTGRAAQIIEVEDQATLISELKQIDLAMTQQPLELCDFVRRGKRVRVINGPFKGLEGVVKSLKGRTRLVLNIEAIRQAAAVEIDLDQVA